MVIEELVDAVEFLRWPSCCWWRRLLFRSKEYGSMNGNLQNYCLNNKHTDEVMGFFVEEHWWRFADMESFGTVLHVTGTFFLIWNSQLYFYCDVHNRSNRFYWNYYNRIMKHLKVKLMKHTKYANTFRDYNNSWWVICQCCKT